MKRPIVKHLLILTLVLTASFSLGSCRKEKPKPNVDELYCDDSFRNIMSQEIDVFEFDYPDKSIVPTYTDQKSCIDAMLDSGVRSIVIARPFTEKEIKYVKDKYNRTVRQQMIAVDAIAMIVNPENNTYELTRKDLIDILTGKVAKWDEVYPGNEDLDSIKVIFDNQNSSVVSFMRDSVLNGELFGNKVFAQGSPEKVFETVAKDKNAIGILGVSWISSDMRGKEITREQLSAESKKSETTETVLNEGQIKVLHIRDINGSFKPYQRNLIYRDYPLTRQIWMITTGAPRSVSHNFYSFVTGPQGQKLIQTTGVLPTLVNLAPVVELAD